MSVAFAARRGRDGWRIGPVAPGAAGAWRVGDDDIRRFTAASNRLIGALISDEAFPDEAWRLEIEKLCAVDGPTALGVADAFAARCLAAPGAEHRLEGEPRDVHRWALMAALAARGERVEGLGRARLAARLRYLAAAAGALAAWGAILLREPGGGRLPDADLVFAVHPEETNRTGHVLNALAKSAPRTPLILLGRPMASRQAVRALLARRGLEPVAAVRPYDVGSALAALPATLRRLWRGADAIAASPFLPSLREQMASAFRVCLGGAGAVWWRRARSRPDTVVYGHCGSADTVLLERAQQAGGTRTVHWLHGLSAGYVYGGVSDACVFQCGSDARWHERLGGYGRNLTYPLPRPPTLRRGEAGWLVLTNFVHWAHPTFPTHGTRDERLMMDLVADAAARAGVPPAEVVWKPHPVLYAMSPQVQDEVRAALAQHGFTLWPPEDRDFGRAAAFATIVSTPSGAAVDVLKLGRLPVIAALGPVDPDHALAGFPLYARTGEALCEAALAPADPALFDRAWAAVQPGAAPSLEQLARAAQPIAADGPPGVVCAPLE